MPDQYRVDLAHLDAVTSKMEGLNEFVSESLREITERIATVQQGWAGEAADAQATAQAEWDAAAVKVYEGLDRMKRAAAAAHASYSDASAANLSVLGRNGRLVAQ